MAIISASLQVSLDRVGDLGVDDGEPAGADGDGVASDARLLERVDELVGPFDRLRLGAFDVGHHEGVVAVAAAQRRRIAERPVRHGEVDVLEAGDELGDLGPGGPRLVAVDVAVGGGDDEDDVRLDLAERLLEDLLGTHRLGTGGLEPAGDQVAGDAAAEHRGGDRQQQARRPAWTAGGGRRTSRDERASDLLGEQAVQLLQNTVNVTLLRNGVTAPRSRASPV